MVFICLFIGVVKNKSKKVLTSLVSSAKVRISIRKVYDDMNERTKKIICPEHGQHEATLYLHGGKFAGIWECDVEGISDSCDHKSFSIDTATVDYYDPSDAHGHGQSEVEVYVCDDCECTVDGDPKADRQEAIEEQQLMEMLGK